MAQNQPLQLCPGVGSLGSDRLKSGLRAAPDRLPRPSEGFPIGTPLLEGSSGAFSPGGGLSPSSFATSRIAGAAPTLRRKPEPTALSPLSLPLSLSSQQ